MHPALFLDRDGVIIENRPNYVRSWADVEIYPDQLQRRFDTCILCGGIVHKDRETRAYSARRDIPGNIMA
jgi:hypothetical protein